MKLYFKMFKSHICLNLYENTMFICQDYIKTVKITKMATIIVTTGDGTWTTMDSENLNRYPRRELICEFDDPLRNEKLGRYGFKTNLPRLTNRDLSTETRGERSL